MARTKKIKAVFTEVTLEQLCRPLNVEQELSDDDIQEMQLKIDELESEVSTLKDDIENERERADNAHDESENYRIEIEYLQNEVYRLENEIEELKDVKPKKKINNTKRKDVVGNVIKMWG